MRGCLLGGGGCKLRKDVPYITLFAYVGFPERNATLVFALSPIQTGNSDEVSSSVCRTVHIIFTGSFEIFIYLYKSSPCIP